MTLADLAKRFGVSASTISRALNPATAPMVAEPLRGRIQDLARRCHFAPNQAARSLVHGRSHSIGVILYSAYGSLFFSDYLTKIHWGIAAALGEHPGYGSKIVFLPRGKSMSDIDQEIAGSGVDGILVSTICDYTIERLQDLVKTVEMRWRRPVVALNIGTLPRSQISTVSFSNRQAAYDAVTHLLRKGHQRIGMIYTENPSPDIHERREGYRSALADHHLPCDSELMVPGKALSQGGYEAAIELFKRKIGASVTAIFCSSDEMAFGAMKALGVLRKRCPQDVAVMGFDGLEAGEHVSPALSTVEQPFLEIAQTGTHLLLDLIEGRQTKPAHITIPSRLILRDSA